MSLSNSESGSESASVEAREICMVQRLTRRAREDLHCGSSAAAGGGLRREGRRTQSMNCLFCFEVGRSLGGETPFRRLGLLRGEAVGPLPSSSTSISSSGSTALFFPFLVVASIKTSTPVPFHLLCRGAGMTFPCESRTVRRSAEELTAFPLG